MNIGVCTGGGESLSLDSMYFVCGFLNKVLYIIKELMKCSFQNKYHLHVKKN